MKGKRYTGKSNADSWSWVHRRD